LQVLPYAPAGGANANPTATLTIAFGGFGRKGAVRLLARGGTGWDDKTQSIYIS
jgi:hypothetical protein